MVIISPSFDNAAQKKTATGAPNNKTGYRSGTRSSFQTSPSSACSILMAENVSRDSKETACCLLLFDVSIGALHQVGWFGEPLRKRQVNL
ncbi:hypothetical protein TNCV_3956581 [Trichonephila clavipes]|nr:hypothetical protein TNCV_3956581 [Trichonephila clavipes]